MCLCYTLVLGYSTGETLGDYFGLVLLVTQTHNIQSRFSSQFNKLY